MPAAPRTALAAALTGLAAHRLFPVGSPVNVTGYHARTRVPCMYLDPDDRERFDDTCNYTMPVRFSPVVATKPFPVMFVVARFASVLLPRVAP